MRHFLQALSRLIVADITEKSERIQTEKDPLVRSGKRVLLSAKDIIKIETFKARQIGDNTRLGKPRPTSPLDARCGAQPIGRVKERTTLHDISLPHR